MNKTEIKEIKSKKLKSQLKYIFFHLIFSNLETIKLKHILKIILLFVLTIKRTKKTELSLIIF